MSRTYKDRPYWVILNQDGIYTDHDHLHLGDPIYRSRRLKGENGMYLTEERVSYKSALEIVHGDSLWGSGAVGYEEAKLALSRNETDAQIPVYTHIRYKTERILVGHIPDHCTAGEKLSDTKWLSNLPCTPALPRSEPWWHHRGGSARHEFSNNYYRGKRQKSRDALRETVKGYNSGTDAEDYEDDLNPLTDQHRHGVWWYLW